MQFNERITPDERWIFSIILFIAIAGFILLTLSVRNGTLTHFDQSILTWFHKIKNPALDQFFSTVTWLGSLWILLPLYILLSLLLSNTFDNFEKVLGIGFWGATLTTYALKYTLERKRPHFFSTIYELPIDPSFPSAHTVQIITFTLLLWLIFYTASSMITIVFGTVLLLIALMVVISRMYLQVHFPSDILAGFLVAIAWVSISILVVKSGVSS
ncbi:MAG TPA: phosphatase PAP2 family protein [Sulfuricurvum sp.]|nr:phosphatase PAP2 family protein [Sulfuricurvum sp.]